MRKIIDHYCSVVSEKIPTLGATVQWETRQATFPTRTVGPWVGMFLSQLNTKDVFYLSHSGKTTKISIWCARNNVMTTRYKKVGPSTLMATSVTTMQIFSEFMKQVEKKRYNSRLVERFYLFLATSSINSILQQHEC